MFLRCIGIPQFVSHMFAGMILGPHLIDLLSFSSDRLSLDVALDGNVALEGVAKFGLIMFTFLMGVKTNKRAAFQIDKRTVSIAVSSFLVTMFAGMTFRNFGIDKVDPLYMPLRLAPTERTVIVAVQAITLLPVVTHLVYELKIPNSELGRLAISTAAINDLLGFMNLIFVSYVGTYRYVSPGTANRDAVAIVILVLMVLFIIKPAAQWIVDTTPEGKPVPRFYLYGTIMAAIAASIYSTMFNQITVLGALLVGMAIPDGPPLGSALEAKYESLVSNIFFPISIAVMTMKGAIWLLQLLTSQLNHETKDRGVIAVTALHLVKLAGRAFPVLIPHDKRSKPRLHQNSYIQTMMLAFTEFQQENWGSTTVNSFTAYSHENLMDQDICNLALDHLTSMIIIPSGRKWSPDGVHESDDMMIRRVNTSLLDLAPCSIGVLNDRGYRKGNMKNKKRTNDTVNVSVIFIGGKDDREALSLAKWMRHNPRVRLTVTRFLSGQDPEKAKNWDYLVDDEVLNDLKETYSTAENFTYKEKTVQGGPAVATTVRLLAEGNDLMIVGRDHDDALLDFSGLVEWMELPELGVVGDLLASKELRTRVSVLVVQQQQQQHG
ncbi:hypothetical protein AALP_AA8G406000 [Arabis alpina]|uniref:Uncharacterized protein n=1 Tax=Arabis alpina TaxID=50452 RepID=A0A087GCK8_ARAAL|nr:hypothetical protein AALP_AA8G406000 [Arabis alpina]